jgi:alpha-glucosidase
MRTDHFIRFERVDSVDRTGRGLLARLHGEQLRVEPVADDVVRIQLSRGGVFDEHPTYAVCIDPFDRDVAWSVESDEHAWRLRTDGLVVTLWLDPFRVDVHRVDGSVVLETMADEQGRHWTYATLNDAWTTRRRIGPGDAVYGLGEKGGSHNRRGRDFTMWNVDVLNEHATEEFRAGLDEADPRADRTSVEFDPYYVNIPFFYHRDSETGRVAGSFVDNGYRGSYEFSRDDEYRVSFHGGQWTEYVFAGPSMPAVLERYTWLTGRASLPPLWALGYHQCRWHAYSQDDVERIAQHYRDDDFPCDGMWLDIDYMDGYRVFTWDKGRFPDPERMLKSLATNGFRTISIVDPGVKHDPGYDIYDDGLSKDVFCRTEGGDTYIGQVWPGNTVFPDFATPEARAWWGELNARHVESGLAGIWNDMNEPATGEIPWREMRFDHGQVSHERLHNQYALLMAMGTVEGLRAAHPDLRTFVLSRAGFAGIQRFAANWMGDNQARWDHLWVSVPMACGFGLSGQPFVGADIGGFQGDTNPELFLRWMQLGALTPFCRNHSEIGRIEQYPWSFGEELHSLAREAIRLRYRLMPYIYSAFVRASETGEPVQRPLVFDYQHDDAVVDLDDEYLFGRDLLVAPVTEAGTTSREVYLPEGDWYDWHTGELLHGRQSVIVETPLERIPVFVRAGAVVPMWPEAPTSTDGYAPETVELHVFEPAVEGRWQSVLVEDDGLTAAGTTASAGRLTTTVVVSRTDGVTSVEHTTVGTAYDGHRRTRFDVVTHGADGRGAPSARSGPPA